MLSIDFSVTISVIFNLLMNSWKVFRNISISCGICVIFLVMKNAFAIFFFYPIFYSSIGSCFSCTAVFSFTSYISMNFSASAVTSCLMSPASISIFWEAKLSQWKHHPKPHHYKIICMNEQSFLPRYYSCIFHDFFSLKSKASWGIKNIVAIPKFPQCFVMCFSRINWRLGKRIA